MFSIAAINDTESKCHCDPLAPTKEAQEFYITQSYHEGLLKLQAKDYDNAREILESVLKDPLISGAQVDGCASDGHLLQLRFLALKNLATVFLQQGPFHFESALRCYLQAVEIDAKDSVVWNQLGTLSCSMDFLSISRWAFEQGLVCSPNNWNCMEKLLEVLIAIGDEVACLSVAELILRHWPSHSRAFHVKTTIKESVPIPFSPRGIDNLKPTHPRLKFLCKRKAIHGITDEGIVSKKMNQNEELHLVDVSWCALTDALLRFFSTFNDSDTEQCTSTKCRSSNTRLSISLPARLDKLSGCAEKKGIIITKASENITLGDCSFEKPSILEESESCFFGEQSQERRSTRLERLRNQRQGKDDQMHFANNNDLAKTVIKCLQPFIVRTRDSDDSSYSINGPDDLVNPSNNEATDVEGFVTSASKNYGVYHLSHLLLEEVASKSPPHQDYFVKLFELEKFTRHCGQKRTPECNLFLAELYHDFGCHSFESEFISDVSYHLCKIIETVALDCPFHLDNGSHLLNDSVQGRNLCSLESLLDKRLFDSKRSFWVRFYWLSGQLSCLEGDKEKAHDEFCISFLLLTKRNDENESLCSVQRPHCKVVQQLTPDRILLDINLLEIDFLLKEPVIDMMERGMYLECINLLAPLLFSSNDIPVDFLPKEGGVSSVELSAIDVILKACEKTKPMNTEVSLNCHYRRLQILMVAAGMEEKIAPHKLSLNFFGSNALLTSNSDTHESPNRQYIHLISEEVKAISMRASQDSSDPCTNYNGFSFRIRSIGEIQSLLAVLMYNITNRFLSNKSSGLAIVGQIQQKCFINAATGFCKLYHLSPTVPFKSQVELIVAIHDLLAEYGLCCAGEDGEGEEGTFLKLAIKHLLALDTKLKPSLNQKNDMKFEEQVEDSSQHNASPLRLNITKQNVEFGQTKPVVEEEHISDLSNGKRGIEEIGSNQCIEYSDELNENVREELELALDQCFFCLYGLNLRSDPSYEDGLATHRNTSQGDYQTKEQCADVFQYILPYAKASSKTGLLKLRKVLRAIWKHFPQPSENILIGNAIDRFLDDPNLSETKLTEAVGTNGFLDSMLKMILRPDDGNLKDCNTQLTESSEPYFEVYCNLYYLLAQSEEMSATDKWPGFVLTKEGEEFVEQNVKLFKYDLLYNPLRFDSWKRLAHIYDEEVDLLLNDGSKHINVVGWSKNATLTHRVDTSRRRSRRCLLMSLALAKTPVQQCEMHELLALVYYDSLQNVVPLYDQRSVQPSKDEAWMMLCGNSKKHFEEAFSRRQDWSHTFYLGKLSEKLGSSLETIFSYYDKSITLNPSAVDPVYRMHASRLKLLCSRGKQDVDTIKVVAAYSFNELTKETVMNILEEVKNDEAKIDVLEKAWNILYTDSLSALQTCTEGDLKHFHKARYRLAQGLYTRHEGEYLQSSKDELSFCFKSSRSSFTINMWEIDGMVKKGRRKAQGLSGNRKSLEVNLPESSRKFITCIRKYMLFYLKILEENEDICTLERAYTSLRTDKRFSLCLDDLAPVALGRYIRAIISSIDKAEIATHSPANTSLEHLQEKIFTFFIEHGNLWSNMCNLPEFKDPGFSESRLSGYLYKYIQFLEENARLETLDAIFEKIKKRFRNPKLSNTNYAKICRYASIVWCRTILISLVLSTPSNSQGTLETLNSDDGGIEKHQFLCVDLETTDELWNSSFDDSNHQKNLKTKWGPMLCELKNVVVKKIPEGNLEMANTLLRCCYNLYKESSFVGPPMPSFGVNLCLVTVNGAEIQRGVDGIESSDLTFPKKLLFWAYALSQGHCANIYGIIKHCEENAKSRIKKGSSILSTTSNASTQVTVTKHTDAGKEAVDCRSTTCGIFPPGTDKPPMDIFVGKPILHYCTNSASEVSGDGDGNNNNINNKCK